jgi:hypothetical protein
MSSGLWAFSRLHSSKSRRECVMPRKGNDHNNDHVLLTHPLLFLPRVSLLFLHLVRYTLLHCLQLRSQCLPYHSFEGGALRFCCRSFVFLWRNLWLPLPRFPIHRQLAIPKRVFKQPIPALGRYTIDRARYSLRRPLKPSLCRLSGPPQSFLMPPVW